ncbi:MAG: acyltransferase family protein [Bdellovibrionaceae bacterium]|nr:acyltransferase family protein [Bdellovibrionales bacterium]MCB9085863.1 acyltransferase family protein [Pseudobdellovibrionaceae bacterium]
MRRRLSDYQVNEDVLDPVARAVTWFGKVYNDYEVEGLENIPTKGPALVVFYHGLVPLDLWYCGLLYYLETGRKARALGDNFLFKVPGLGWLVSALGGVPGDPDLAVKLLKEGNVVGVSPGGVREAISGADNDYKLMWGQRQGFARVALEAQVPIVPGFTRNVEGLYRAPFAGTDFIQNLYEKTRWPLVPILGVGALPFPVKLVSHIGKPIPYDPKDTPTTLVEKTRQALEVLIENNQPKDSSVLSGMEENWLSRLKK